MSDQKRVVPDVEHARQSIELREGWEFAALPAVGFHVGATEPASLAAQVDSSWRATEMPRQVQEVLLERNEIPDPFALGGPAESQWVAEKDWVYRTTFIGDPTRQARLRFEGLDTLVDVYLNGEHILRADDMFIPWQSPVLKVAAQNEIVMHFHSPWAFLRRFKESGDPWNGRISHAKVLRKANNDFSPYLGAKPFFTPIGPYGPVLLEYLPSTFIEDLDISSQVQADLGSAIVTVTPTLAGQAESTATVTATLRDPDGHVVATDAGDASARELSVSQPALWWPRGYGEQNLYELEVALSDGEHVLDRKVRVIGLRRLEMPEPFKVVVNNVHVRVWGAQTAPLRGIGHRYDPERARLIMDRAEAANMNALRIWGGSDPLHDDFYDECDARGLLVWQEFFHDYGMYPDDDDYRDKCRREARHQVSRLKHHPSLFMWCGGNEVFMGAAHVYPGEDTIGKEIFLEDYPAIVAELDPQRYYHLGSPTGGDFDNDPRAGDTHSLTSTWFVPHASYPTMIAEEIRVSPPRPDTARVLFEGLDAWPDDYSGLLRHGDMPWPDSWTERTVATGWRKIPEIERFHDAGSLDEAIYRFGAAHAAYLRGVLENNRRGRPWYDAQGPRLTHGHFVCRWNDSWPVLYGSLLDVFGHPYQPFYATMRAYEPVLVSIDIGEEVQVWVVNDTKDTVDGELEVLLYDPHADAVARQLQRSVRVEPGGAHLITDLNEFGEFDRSTLIHATLRVDGERLTSASAFADIERHLTFPDATLEVSQDGADLVVRTDRFARCVELTAGDSPRDDWFFSDNYFDLAPFEERRVSVATRNPSGTIAAKAHFSSSTTQTDWHRPTQNQGAVS